MNDVMVEIVTNGNNDTGYLSFFQSDSDIPFAIKRIYYTYGVPVGIKRGMHAHKKLQQLIWCPFGEIEVILDDGYERKSYLLNEPNKGLLLRKGYWRDIYWKKENSVLCVAASDFYNEDDYIRNYEEYKDWVQSGGWKNENKF